MKIIDFSYSFIIVGVLMVFVVLNLGELKFYLFGMNIIEKFFFLGCFLKIKIMFFKGDICIL